MKRISLFTIFCIAIFLFALSFFIPAKITLGDEVIFGRGILAIKQHAQNKTPSCRTKEELFGKIILPCLR
ncbi:MAG: hypothetical protein ACREGI_03240 [Candidatus Levyibacteriota bacterium]